MAVWRVLLAMSDDCVVMCSNNNTHLRALFLYNDTYTVGNTLLDSNKPIGGHELHQESRSFGHVRGRQC